MEINARELHQPATGIPITKSEKNVRKTVNPAKNEIVAFCFILLRATLFATIIPLLFDISKALCS